MNNLRAVLSVIFMVALVSWTASAQALATYEELVEQGKTQIQAGNNDIALGTANRAIQSNPNRWEAYSVEGSALMNLKRYKEAADQFGLAIARAPETKQADLRELRKKCLLSEDGATVTIAPAAITGVVGKSADASGPSYQETVHWIQDHIKLAGIPGGNEQDHGFSTSYSDQEYMLKVNGCSSIDLIITSHYQMTDMDDNSQSSFTRTADYRIPLVAPQGIDADNRGVIKLATDLHQPTEPNAFHSEIPVPGVEFIFNKDVVSLSFANSGSDSGLNLSKQNVSVFRESVIPSPNGNLPDPHYEATNQSLGFVIPGYKAVRISYGKPGTSDEPQHMVKALEHLITLCTQNPDAAPKELF